MFAFLLGTTAAVFSTFYSIRLLYLCFIGRTRVTRPPITGAHELNPYMGTPLIGLAFGSIFAGYYSRDLFIGSGSQFWGTSIILPVENPALIDFEFIPTSIKLIPLYASMLGCILFILSVSIKSYPNNNQIFNTLYAFFANKWYFDQIYNYFLVKPFLFLGQRVTFEIIDRGFLEAFGPYGITRQISIFLKSEYKQQSGNINYYLFTFTLGLALLLIYTFIF
jgi:NADH-ubiquinone oxidoreductase chain 5